MYNGSSLIRVSLSFFPANRCEQILHLLARSFNEKHHTQIKEMIVNFFYLFVNYIAFQFLFMFKKLSKMFKNYININLNSIND